MRIKHLLAAAVLSLSVTGVMTAITQPASAAAKNSKYYRLYKTMPKALRGTWQQKGYSKYKKGIKVRWTYKFNKNSYAMKMNFKGGNKKSKTIKFYKKNIYYMDYRYATKQYEISPTTYKLPASKVPYAGILYLKPVHHNGKKALAYYPIGGTKDYFYRK